MISQEATYQFCHSRSNRPLAWSSRRARPLAHHRHRARPQLQPEAPQKTWEISHLLEVTTCKIVTLEVAALENAFIIIILSLL